MIKIVKKLGEKVFKITEHRGLKYKNVPYDWWLNFFIYHLNDDLNFYQKGMMQYCRHYLKSKDKVKHSTDKGRTGKVWITDGTNSKSIFPTEKIPDGWRRGKHERGLSDEQKKKMSDNHFINPSLRMKRLRFIGMASMKKHTKIYMDYFGYSIGDYIPCEITGKPVEDVHHINCKGMGGNPKDDKNVIENLMGTTRKLHLKFGDKKQYMDLLNEIHLKFMEDKQPLILTDPKHKIFDLI